jgi:hypothetical protein
MASSLTISSTVSLTLSCSTDNQSKTTASVLYRPGDLISAFIELHKHRSFEAMALHGSLVGMNQSLHTTSFDGPLLMVSVGETRVWTHPAGREDIFQTMIHTHLNLTAGHSHVLPSINGTAVGDALIAPLTFVLPELATESKSPDSNSRLPPSCELGSLYIDPWERSYMQPLIEYSLHITLRFRLLGETAIRAISAKHKIKVTTAPHCEPPRYSETI